jgi:hypothetical protein
LLPLVRLEDHRHAVVDLRHVRTTIDHHHRIAVPPLSSGPPQPAIANNSQCWKRVPCAGHLAGLTLRLCPSVAGIKHRRPSKLARQNGEDRLSLRALVTGPRLEKLTLLAAHHTGEAPRHHAGAALGNDQARVARETLQPRSWLRCSALPGTGSPLRQLPLSFDRDCTSSEAGCRVMASQRAGPVAS